MHTWTALALSLLAVSASAAPPHLEARKGAAPVGGPASAKVTIYSGYTCLAPGTVCLDLLPRTRALLTTWLASTYRRQCRNGNHIHNRRSHVHNSDSQPFVRRSNHGDPIDHTKDWNRWM